MRDGVKPRLTSRRWRACSGSSSETIDRLPAPPPFGRMPCPLQNSSGWRSTYETSSYFEITQRLVAFVPVHGIVLAQPVEHVVRDTAHVQRGVERVELEVERGGGHVVFLAVRLRSVETDADAENTWRARGRARARRAVFGLRQVLDHHAVRARSGSRARPSGSCSAGASGQQIVRSHVRERGFEQRAGVEQRLQHVVVAVDRLGEQRAPEVGLVASCSTKRWSSSAPRRSSTRAGEAFGERRARARARRRGGARSRPGSRSRFDGK